MTSTMRDCPMVIHSVRPPMAAGPLLFADRGLGSEHGCSSTLAHGPEWQEESRWPQVHWTSGFAWSRWNHVYLWYYRAWVWKTHQIANVRQFGGFFIPMPCNITNRHGSCCWIFTHQAQLMWVYGITILSCKNIHTFAYIHLTIKIPNQMHYTSWVYPWRAYCRAEILEVTVLAHKVMDEWWGVETQEGRMVLARKSVPSCQNARGRGSVVLK